MRKAIKENSKGFKTSKMHFAMIRGNKESNRSVELPEEDQMKTRMHNVPWTFLDRNQSIVERTTRRNKRFTLRADQLEAVKIFSTEREKNVRSRSCINHSSNLEIQSQALLELVAIIESHSLPPFLFQRSIANLLPSSYSSTIKAAVLNIN